MHLTQEAIDEFKAIYKSEFGQEISDDEAREMGTRLLRLFRVLMDNGDELPTIEPPPHNHPEQPE